MRKTPRSYRATSVAVVVSSILLASCTNPGQGPKIEPVKPGLTSDQYIKQAQSYLSQRKNPEAEANFKAAIDAAEAANRSTAAARATVKLAHLYLNENELAKAEQMLQKAAEMDKQTALAPKTRAQMWAGFGRLSLLQNKPEAASGYLEKAIAERRRFDDADSADSWLPYYMRELTSVYSKIGNASALEKLLQERAKLSTPDPSLAGDFNNLGESYFHKGKIDQALSLYNSVLKLKRQHVQDNAALAEAHSGMAAIFVVKGDFVSAEKQAQAALAAVGSKKQLKLPILNQLLFIETKLNKPASASTYLAQAVEIQKETGPSKELSSALAHLGSLYLTTKTYDKAEKTLSECVEVMSKTGELQSPLAGVVFYDLGRLHLLQKHYDLAVSDLSKALETNSEKSSLSRYQQSLSYAQSQISIKTAGQAEISNSALSKTITLIKEKKFAEADAELRQRLKALEQANLGESAQAATVHNLLGQVLSEESLNKESQEHFSHAIRIATKADPSAVARYKNAAAYFSWEGRWNRITYQADQLLSQKNYPAAATLYRQAKDLATKNNNKSKSAMSNRALINALFNSGKARFLAKKPAEAEVMLKEALTLIEEDGQSNSATAASTHALLAQALSENNLSTEAAEHFRKAISIAEKSDRKQVSYYKQLAAYHGWTGRFDRLLFQGDKLCSQKQFAAGINYYRQARDLARANNADKEARRAAKALAEGLLQQGSQLVSQKNFSAAEIALKESLLALSESGQADSAAAGRASIVLGQSLSEQNKMREAAQALDKAVAIAEKVDRANLKRYKDSRQYYGWRGRWDRVKYEADQLTIKQNYAQAVVLYKQAKQLAKENNGNAQVTEVDKWLSTALLKYGKAVLATNNFQQAETLLTEAISILNDLGQGNSPASGEAHHSLALALTSQGNVEEAQAHLKIASKFRKWDAVWNDLQYDGNQALSHGAHTRAISLFQQAYDLAKSNDDKKRMAESAEGLARVYALKSRPKQAEEVLFSKITELEKSKGHEELLAKDYREVAWLQRGQGRNKDAEESFHKSIAFAEKKPSPTTKNILAADYIDLARLMIDQNKLVDAGHFLNRAAVVAESLGGKQGPVMADVMAARAALSTAQKSWKEAEQFARQALAIKTKVAKDKSDLIYMNQQLAAALLNTQKMPEAEKVLRQSVAIAEERFGKNSFRTVSPLLDLSYTLRREGKFDEAAAVLLRIIELREKFPNESGPQAHRLYADLAEAYNGRGKFPMAEKAITKAQSLIKQDSPDNAAQLADYKEILARIYFASNHRKETIPLWSSIVSLRETALGKNNARTLESMTQLAYLYREVGRKADSDRLFEEIKQRRMQQ